MVWGGKKFDWKKKLRGWSRKKFGTIFLLLYHEAKWWNNLYLNYFYSIFMYLI